MKVISGLAKNFGSYSTFEFDFSTPGLHLISGPTGSGKSTICDLIPWTLFGVTAKNGAANDVVSWGADEDTFSEVIVDTATARIAIHRRRGKSNDLYFRIGTETSTRGKDLKDTQKLLNEALGCTTKQYLTSAYYHELSDTAQFFQTTATNRRLVTEQLVDLTQVIKAQKGLTEAEKSTKSLIASTNKTVLATESSLILTRKNSDQARLRANHWDKDQGNKLTDLENKAFGFDSDKESKVDKALNQVESWNSDNRQMIFQLEKSLQTARERMLNGRTVLADLEGRKASLKHAETCPTCGSKTNSAELADATEDLMVAMQLAAEATTKVQQIESSLEVQRSLSNPYERQVELAKAATNPYLNQLRAAISEETNPHILAFESFAQQADSLEASLQQARLTLAEESRELFLIETAKELTDTVRQALIETSIREIEQETNRLLEAHFDAVMRIEFVAEEFDKLDVNITKDGHAASFGQLSKGQQQMLRLCFSVSCMKTASSRIGVKFEQLFIDEGLNGLDDELKVKSFSLLEELNDVYNSVYVVEHNSNLKSMFTSTYNVSIGSGTSEIENNEKP